MADRAEVGPGQFEGHTQECLRIAQVYGYKLLKESGTPDRYYLIPPNTPPGSEPPAEVKLKQPTFKPIKNPLEITPPKVKSKPNDLEDNLDRVVRDEMDLKQYDSRWQSYIYGPVGNNAGWVSGAGRKRHVGSDGKEIVGENEAGWSDMGMGGCGAMTMATIMMFLMRQKGFTPPRDTTQKDAQWGEVKDVTDWMGSSIRHGRVKGSGTGQGLIDLTEFQAKWPGFSLKQYYTVDQAIAALRSDTFIILNGAFGVFNNIPTAKSSLPDKYYKGHNIVLWSVEKAEPPHDFEYIRIFDPGGAGRYILADHLRKGGYKDKEATQKNMGGQFWEPYRVQLIPEIPGFADGIAGAPNRFSSTF